MDRRGQAVRALVGDVVAATVLLHDRAVDLLQDEPHPRDALLARFLTLGSRAELETIVRAHPELLDRGVEESLDRIVAGMPNSSAAGALRRSSRAHMRVLAAFGAMRAELLTLAQVANERRRSFEHSGDVEVLTAAVAGWQTVVAHPGMTIADLRLRTAVLTEAGSTMLLLAQRMAEGTDLEEALRCLRQAVEDAPDGRPRWIASVNLAAALRERNSGDDLVRAADLLATVLDQVNHGHDDVRAVAATTLGHVESDRFQATADPRLLDAAEAAYSTALELTNVSSPRRVARLCHVTTIGIERWRVGGDAAELARAIAILEEAVAGADRSRSRVTALTDLAIALGELFEHTGDIQHLDRAIELLGEADDAEPKADRGNRVALLCRRYEVIGDPGDLLAIRGMWASFGGLLVVQDDRQRAAVLLTLHEHGGNPTDLDAAVESASRAVREAGPARRASALVNLGTALSGRYSATGQVADLEQAVEAYRDAVTETPPQSPRRALRLANLADAVRERAHRLGRVSDLDDAMELLVAALQATPVAAAGRHYRLSALATAMLDRSRRSRSSSRSSADLRTALDLSRMALNRTPVAAPDWPARLGLHAACLHEAWREGQDRTLLDQAIEFHRASVAVLAERAPTRFRHQQNLAHALADRAVLCGDPADRDEALALFRRAYSGAAERDPWAAVVAARNWGAGASSWHDWAEAAQAYLKGLQVVSTLVGTQQGRRHKEGWLRDAQQLPAGAALALTRLGHVAEAVAVLDTGRAVLLTGAAGR